MHANRGDSAFNPFKEVRKPEYTITSGEDMYSPNYCLSVHTSNFNCKCHCQHDSDLPIPPEQADPCSAPDEQFYGGEFSHIVSSLLEEKDRE